MRDLLYSRYANPQFFFEMDIEEGIEMIKHIYEKQSEERHFTLYASQYPNMTEETFVPFEDFYKPQEEQKVSEEKSAEEILKEVRGMMNSHSVGGEK